MGVIADTFAASLKTLAESDARLYSVVNQHMSTMRKLLHEAYAPLMIADDSRIAAAITLLQENGYTVTR